MNEPLVSIVIPYFNKKDTIGRSLNSVLAQNYQFWELIIIDDCGNEKLDIGQLPKDNRISILYNDKNLGAAVTRQRGLDESKGEYIAFLDADDWWDDCLLETSVNKLREIDDCAGVYVKVIDIENTNKFRRNAYYGKTDILKTILAYRRPWQTSGIIWKRKFTGTWGSLKTNEDSWFEITSSLKNNKLIYIDEVNIYHSLDGMNHLSKLNGISNTVLNQQELFFMIYGQFYDQLTLKYKIILLNRLLRGQLRICENCDIPISREYAKRLNDRIFVPFFLLKNIFLLKIIHKLLQRTIFKINF